MRFEIEQAHHFGGGEHAVPSSNVWTLSFAGNNFTLSSRCERGLRRLLDPA
jgi:hypothetical protein